MNLIRQNPMSMLLNVIAPIMLVVALASCSSEPEAMQQEDPPWPVWDDGKSDTSNGVLVPTREKNLTLLSGYDRILDMERKRTRAVEPGELPAGWAKYNVGNPTGPITISYIKSRDDLTREMKLSLGGGATIGPAKYLDYIRKRVASGLPATEDRPVCEKCARAGRQMKSLPVSNL